MKAAQELTDKFSIGLSSLCAIHCLVLPLLLVLMPSLGALNLENEAFHLWMLITVIPTSIYALTIGCKKHKRYRLFSIGAAGLLLLILAIIIGHDIAADWGEKILTLLGASLVVIAHIGNFRLCQKHDNCPCPNHRTTE